MCGRAPRVHGSSTSWRLGGGAPSRISGRSPGRHGDGEPGRGDHRDETARPWHRIPCPQVNRAFGVAIDQSTALASKGIHDRASAIDRATVSRNALLAAGRSGLQSGLKTNDSFLTLLGLLSRAQAFHDGALNGVQHDNPFASATLIRAYSETVAALIWIQAKPGDLPKFSHAAPKREAVPIGKLVNFARTQSDGFKGIYDQLSGFAHPTSAGGLSGVKSVAEDGTTTWQSRASFRTDDDVIHMCLWILELAEVAGGLLVEIFTELKRSTSARNGAS